MWSSAKPPELQLWGFSFWAGCLSYLLSNHLQIICTTIPVTTAFIRVSMSVMWSPPSCWKESTAKSVYHKDKKTCNTDCEHKIDT